MCWVVAMITERKEIIHLLNDYIETEHERTQIFWGSAPNWEVDREVKYFNGVVMGKYRENDPETLKILNEQVSKEALYDEVSIHLQNKIYEYKQQNKLDIHQQEMFIEEQNKYEFLRANGIEMWVTKYSRWLEADAQGLNDNQIRALLFIYYSFDNYMKELKHPFNSDITLVKKIYDGVFEKQSQFEKYGLLPIDDERELLEVEPPRIYDKSIDKTMFIKNMPLSLIKQFILLEKLGYIKDLAVRVINENPYEGKMSSAYLAEALERGQYFNLSELGLYPITRLYSEKYEDCLWITIDARNITFEELCEDFTTYEDVVVTQVIHLEYQLDGPEAYITHLDHEYIFYSLEEYEQRLRDNLQKGNAATRMKSFKIDHSKIPFSYEVEVQRKNENGENLPIEHVQILSYILETYFTHKDLLKEYFQTN